MTKRAFTYSMRTEPRRPNMPWSASSGNVSVAGRQIFHHTPMFVNDHEISMNTDSRFTNKF